MSRRRAQFLEHLARIGAVGDESSALAMGVLLADEPFLCIPGASAAPAGDTFNAAFASDILGAEALELPPWPHFDVEELATAAGAGFCPFAGGLVLRYCHDGPPYLAFPLISNRYRWQWFRCLRPG